MPCSSIIPKPRIPKHTRQHPFPEIGHDGPANHNYDINDFYAAVKAGKLPAVQLLEGSGFPGWARRLFGSPGRAGINIVNVINALQKSHDWESTAVVIAYDDSDRWYDFMGRAILGINPQTPRGCSHGTGRMRRPWQHGASWRRSGGGLAQGRCGYGPRLPLLVVSPWAKKNFVDHTVTDQSSIIHFIEDNWLNSWRIGGGSFDAISNSIDQMFDFESLRSDQCRPFGTRSGHWQRGAQSRRRRAADPHCMRCKLSWTRGMR